MKFIALIMVMAFGISVNAQTTTVLHVDDDAVSNGNGLTWTSAFKYLRDAIETANADFFQPYEIRVAQGVYFPDRRAAVPEGDGMFNSYFRLEKLTALQGGYAGIGTRDPDQRNPVMNVTILNGDINVPGDSSDNVFHVVYVTWPGVSIDGFTITGGNARGGSPDTEFGGGLLIKNGNCELSRCIFVDNKALLGGAIGTSTSAGEIVRACSFIGNHAIIDGGAIRHGHGTLTVEDSLFTANSAGEDGGAIWCDAFWVSLRKVKLTMNQAGHRGGGLMLYPPSPDSFPWIISCEFVGNRANKGGAICTDRDLTDVAGRFVNCTIASNVGLVLGGGIHHDDTNGFPRLENCILWNNESPSSNIQEKQLTGQLALPIVTYSMVQGLNGTLRGVGNLGSDPVFANLNGNDNVPGTMDDDLRLMASSPAIDSGSNSASCGTSTADLANQPRIQDGTGDGTVVVDRGAWESDGMALPLGDITCDGLVLIQDLLAVINAWGPCRPQVPFCTSDIAPIHPDGTQGDNVTNVQDLLRVIGNWS
jgi:predicted outer membrane repeat protein